MIDSRVIGDEERQVIGKWRDKEKVRSSIGGLERPDMLREHQPERDEAAAKDRAKHP